MQCIQSGMRLYIHPGCARAGGAGGSVDGSRPVREEQVYIAVNEMTRRPRGHGGFTGPVAKMFGATVIPHTFTIDADGVLQEEHVGDAFIEGKLKKLLAQAQDRQNQIKTPQ